MNFCTNNIILSLHNFKKQFYSKQPFIIIQADLLSRERNCYSHPCQLTNCHKYLKSIFCWFFEKLHCSSYFILLIYFQRSSFCVTSTTVHTHNYLPFFFSSAMCTLHVRVVYILHFTSLLAFY